MSAPESWVGERKQPPLGPLGTWRFSPRAAGGGGWASLTWAGEEAGTQVPRLFSCEGTVAWDFALGAGGSACISIRASLIFISLSSQFASLAFRFAVSPSLPHPRLSPCWVRGRAGAAPRLTKAAGGEGRSGREVLLGGGGVDPALVGGPMEPAAELPGLAGVESGGRGG